MKKMKKILLCIPFIAMVSCGEVSSSSPISSINPTSSQNSITNSTTESSSQNSTATSNSASSSQSSTINPTSSLTTSSGLSSGSSSSASSTVSSQPIELALTLTLDGDMNSEGIYEVMIFSTLQLYPRFNDPSHQEELTFTAKEGVFGTVSSSVEIDEEYRLIVKNKTDQVITITCKGEESNLTAQIKVKVVAPMDEYNSNLKTKLDAALTKEKDLASGGNFRRKTYTSGSLSVDNNSEFVVFSNKSLESNETNKDNETSYRFAGMYNNKLYIVNKDKDGSISAQEKDSDISNASSLYQVKLSSMESFYGLSATLKNYITSQSYLGSTSCYNHAEVSKDISNNNEVYEILSKYEVSSFGTITYYEFSLTITFNQDKLVSFNLNKASYNSTNYDTVNHELKENAVASSQEVVTASLSYETRQASSNKFNPQSLFITSYEVTLKNKATQEVGTQFEVDTVLSVEYQSYLPETADPSIDKLNFVSSSDTSVVGVNSSNELVCLKEGTCNLTFSTNSGVQKVVPVTVTYSGVQEVCFNESLTNISKLKVGDSISNISAYVKPTLVTQVCSISILSGSENASLTQETDGTYSLTGVHSGEVVLQASTLYNDQEFTKEYQLTVYEPLTDQQIADVLVSKTFTYSKVPAFGATTTHTLTFTETSGTYEVQSSSTYTLTFDYTISNGLIVLSNVSSTSSTYSLVSLSLNDSGTEIYSVIKENSMFGISNYNYTLS